MVAAMISTRQLQHFRAVFKTGSMHTAAEALHLTQPALTRSIANLEEQFGVRLFERSKSGMHPTAFAERVAPRISSVLYELDDLYREARLYRELGTGRICVGVGQALREPLGRHCVAPFIAQHPSVSLRMREGTSVELIAALQARDIDMIIGGTASYRGHPSLRTEAICSVGLQVLVRSDHPVLQRSRVTLEELLAYPLAAPTSLGAHHPLVEVMENAGQLLNPQFMSSDYDVLESIVAATDAWTVTLKGFFTREVPKVLRALDVEGFDLSIDMGVIELSHRSREPAAARFVELMRAQL